MTKINWFFESGFEFECGIELRTKDHFDSHFRDIARLPVRLRFKGMYLSPMLS